MQQGKVILARYHSKTALAQAFMAFTRDGGLFVPTSGPFQMQEPVFLVVNLPDVGEVLLVRGQVSWISAGRRKGVGVAFHSDEAGKKAALAIETYLGAMAGSSAASLTM